MGKKWKIKFVFFHFFFSIFGPFTQFNFINFINSKSKTVSYVGNIHFKCIPYFREKNIQKEKFKCN